MTTLSFRDILFSRVILFVDGTKVRGGQRAQILFVPKGNREKNNEKSYQITEVAPDTPKLMTVNS